MVRGAGGRSTAGDDADDFESVAIGEGTARELGGGDGFAVEFDHDAARQESLLDEELVEGARQRDGNGGAVGRDARDAGWGG